jgi:hypothetical protein
MNCRVPITLGKLAAARGANDRIYLTKKPSGNERSSSASGRARSSQPNILKFWPVIAVNVVIMAFIWLTIIWRL